MTTKNNPLRLKDVLPHGLTYSVGVCEKFVDAPKRRSERGGPRFTVNLNHQRRLVLERHHESPFYNHPFYVVYQKSGWWGWYDVNPIGYTISSINATEKDPREFIKRALAILGSAWVDGVCQEPNQYNLGILLSWYDKMESMEQPWLGIELELDQDEKIITTNKKIITKAAIEQHFARMPQYDGCSLNHQCSREDFDRLRNIAAAPSK